MCVQQTRASGISFGIASGMGAAVAHRCSVSWPRRAQPCWRRRRSRCRCRCALREGSPSSFMGLRTCLVPTPARRASKVWKLVLRLPVDVADRGRQPDDDAAVSSHRGRAAGRKPADHESRVRSAHQSDARQRLLVLGPRVEHERDVQNLQKATLDRLNIPSGILLIGVGAALCARIV